jgi:hypothetical protein
LYTHLGPSVLVGHQPYPHSHLLNAPAPPYREDLLTFMTVVLTRAKKSL